MMRRLSYLCAAALALSQAQAEWLLNPFVLGSGGPTLTFVDCTEDASDLTTYTFAAHSVGTAGARDTIIGVMADDTASAYNTSTVTVGGASATEIVDEAGSDIANTSIHIVDNPTGTSEDIVVTMSEAVVSLTICVWAVYGLASETAVASTANNGTSGAISANLSNTTAGGIAVGVCVTSEGGGNLGTWVGLTLQEAIAGVDSTFSGAHTTPTAGGALSISCDPDGADPASVSTASFF